MNTCSQLKKKIGKYMIYYVENVSTTALYVDIYVG
jgi:hypothetical protein